MKTLLMLTCLALISLGVASAQILTFSSKAPFSVGNGNLPAGAYQIQNVGEDLMTFQISSVSSGHGVMFEADSTDTTPTGSAVTFLEKYGGDKLILKSFSVNGGVGYFIPISLPRNRLKRAARSPPR